MIRVKLLGSFAQGIGKEVELPADEIKRVRDVLERFKGRNPEVYPGNPNIIILVNGVEVGVLKDLETELKDGDEVVLLPAAHGGSSIFCFSVRGGKEILEVIEGIRKKTGAIIQVCRPDCIYSMDHLRLVVLQTMKALEDGESMAQRPEVDFLMRVSLEDQITEAIEKCGHKEGESLLIIFGKKAEEAVEMAKEVLDLKPPHFPSRKRVMKVHGISEKDVKPYPGGLLSFLVERAALLPLKKR